MDAEARKKYRGSIEAGKNDLLCTGRWTHVDDSNLEYLLDAEEERNKLRQQLEQSEAEAAAMKQIIDDIKSDVRYRYCGTTALAAFRKAEQITTAGQSILDRLQRAEAVVDAAREALCGLPNYLMCTVRNECAGSKVCEALTAYDKADSAKNVHTGCEGNGCCARCGEQPSGGDPLCGS